MEAIGVSSEEGERMCSTDMGEDIVIRSKKRCASLHFPDALARFSGAFPHSGGYIFTNIRKTTKILRWLK